jgi:nucleoside-diphosphate-sugar epimerase
MLTTVFVTGGTSYLGRPLIEQLLERGLAVHALARPGGEAKLPPSAVNRRGERARRLDVRVA